MRRFSMLVIIFLLLCIVCILLMRSCGGTSNSKTPAKEETNLWVSDPPATETPLPEVTPVPVTEPTPVATVDTSRVWTTDGVNLRRGPGADQDILAVVEKDTELKRTGSEGDWTAVTYNGMDGYIKTTYITMQDPAATATTPTPSEVTPTVTAEPENTNTFNVIPCNDTVWATDGVNLRRGPGTEYDIGGSVNKDTELMRTGTTESGWSRVIFENVGYYVRSDFLTTVKPEGAVDNTESSAVDTNVSALQGETSGEFTGETGTVLKLVVKWSVTSTVSNAKQLTLDAYVESASLQTTAFADDVCFKIGNDTFYKTSNSIQEDSATLVQNLLASCTATVDKASVPVTVTWNYNGTYSNQTITSIQASTMLPLGN